MNELALTESKVMREEYINRDNVLDRVKALILLPDNMNVTVEMVANYYEVDKKTLEKVVERHNDEFVSDGLKTLKGSELKDFKGYLQNVGNLSDDIKFAPSLTLIPRRAILRIGMLLRDSEIAKQVRTYLLNVENNTTVEIKFQSLIENSNIKLQQLNNQNIELLNQANWINDQNKSLHIEVNCLKTDLCEMKSVLEDMKNNYIFKMYENPSYKYNDLIHRFGYKLNILQENFQFNKFNKEFQNWIGLVFPDNLPNVKQYILNNFGIDEVEKFVNGILTGRIVRSNKGNWVDLNGYTQNDIEFERIKREFNNQCAYCSRNNVSIIPEHIIPKHKEKSTDIIYNIIPACIDCNRDKFDRNMKEWFKEQSFYSDIKLDKIKNHYEKYYVDLKNYK
jgi:hypothetical protein